MYTERNQQQNNPKQQQHLDKSKNSTFGIAAVYNSNKAAACWYR